MKFQWTKIEQDAFGKIYRILDRNTLLAYPNFNKEFKIHIDASDFQPGVVISQNFKPIALCSRKLTSASKSYTVTEN